MMPHVILPPASIAAGDAAAGRKAFATTTTAAEPVLPSPPAITATLPAARVTTRAVESLRVVIVTRPAGDGENANLTPATFPVCPVARAVIRTVSPTTAVEGVAVTCTDKTALMTLMRAVADTPHADALMLTDPRLTACTRPVEPTVATLGSEEVNTMCTSGRAAPRRFVAVAVSCTTSVTRAVVLTGTLEVLGLIVTSRTGLVTSQAKPGPAISSSQATAHHPSAIALTMQMVLFFTVKVCSAGNCVS
jgi:hypothetical protein